MNGAIPSLPSPTMPTFNMAAQTPNGQPGGGEAVYTNGIPQTYPARKYKFILVRNVFDYQPVATSEMKQCI